MELSNIEYERAILGEIMLDNQVLEENRIYSNIFTQPATKRTYTEIMNCIGRGAVADLREVALMLPDLAGEISDMTTHASGANFKHHLTDLTELSRRRMYRALSKKIDAAVEDGADSKEIEDLLEKAQLAIADNKSDGYKAMKEYLPDLLKTIEARSKNPGKLTGIPTGFEHLDEITDGFQKQDYIIIGARPSTGKSVAATNIIAAAAANGYKPGLISAEMSAQSNIMRMISDIGHIENIKLRSGFLSKADLMNLQEALTKMYTYGVFIDDTPNISLGDLKTSARKMKRKEGINILFIDYIGLISHPQNTLPRHEQVSDISKQLKGLARELDIPIVALAQLKRESEDTRPKLSDLRESGSLEQDGDLIILLQNLGWTDDTQKNKKIRWIVAKQRNGALGDISMEFESSYMRMKEVAQKWEDAQKERKSYK